MMKRCYYEILDIEKKATPAQVTKAYRKMALKYHPDKNPGQQAKKIFLQLQQAYDVLSDPNQRTFYDNNRQKILFNKDEMSKEDLQQYSFGFNIWEFFTAKCYKGFTDQQGSFYHVYRQVFENIKAQQAKAFKLRQDLQEQIRKYQGFGISTTQMQKVVSFYEDWQNFTTYKSFSWSEEYDTRDAENRWVKRRMEQQNKKQRQKQKKTYIKTIKDLVNFVKKRDPRFQQYLLHLRDEQQRKQKQKIKKAEQKKKQKEDMKKVKQQLEQERFRQIEEYHKQNSTLQKQTNHNAYEQDDQQAQFYCPICQKTFKSQNQLDNHQKSKQHKQNVKLIQKQVMLPQEIIEQATKDNQEGKNEPAQQPKKKKKRNRKKKNNNANQQNQDEDDQKDEDQKQEEKPKVEQVKPQQKNENKKSDNTKQTQPNNKNNQNKKQSSDQSEQQKPKPNNKNNKQNQQKKQPQQKKQQPEVKKQQKKKPQSQSQQSSDDDDVFMNLVQNINNKKNAVQQDDEGSKKKKKAGKNKNVQKQDKPQNKNAPKAKVEQQSQQDGDQQGQKKLGKAKLKKMKKAEQQKDTGLKCKTCSSVFPSKTKLFDHIKQSGHAAYK